ncbi:hypothetical protein XELAEV_18003868mg [Xenopus laevis]|uniref:Uncharacterized protein n=1 Tax=Xenopus laevis TaxID=8355 RepID=A0A974BNJ8_XENLA|nr:hypothetical protein XELAEV_18003868mg [Xenopus laevis]
MFLMCSLNLSSYNQENSLNSEAVEQTYKRNPILRYTQHPLHSPLLPLPYGDVNLNCTFSPFDISQWSTCIELCFLFAGVNPALC